QQTGRDFYFNHIVDAQGVSQELPADRFHNCATCHVLNPQGNAEFGVAHPGFFGTEGDYSFENETQIFKVPHLRNMYQKVGMFGMSPEPLVPSTLVPGVLSNTGDQVRGFGFQHDGAIDTIDRFFQLIAFLQTDEFLPSACGPTFPPVPPNPFGIPPGPAGAPLRKALESFLFAFDSNMAPIVGQQITLSHKNATAAGPRITLLEARALLGECDLVARGQVRGRERGWLLTANGFGPDRADGTPLSDEELRRLAREGGTALTLTCAPPGAGVRLALDRDGDGFADGDELLVGTDPADPTSHP